FLQLIGVVIARQIEVFEPRHDAVIHDPHNIGFFQVLLHSADRCPILRFRWPPVALAIALHHFREIKIDLVTRAVLHQGDSIAIPDFAANGWDPYGCFRAALDARRPFIAARNLNPPEAEEENAESNQHAKSKKLDPKSRLSAAHIQGTVPPAA